MPSIRNTTAWLTLDGEKLPEHQIEMNGPHVVKCYVPSETGKRFEIIVRDRSPYRSRLIAPSVSIELDGTAIRRSWSPGDFEENCVINGVRGEDFFQPFQFANLTVTDDDSYRRESSGVGIVKVKVRWVGPGVPAVPPPGLLRPNSTFGSEPVHERAKKMTTHRIVLGASTPMSRSGWISRPPLPRYTPIEFHFQYANKDLLMARNIMPAPVSHSPVGLKRTIDIEDSENELTREEEETFKRLQEKVRRRDNKRIKAEVKAEVPAFHVTENGVIDLTED